MESTPQERKSGSSKVIVVVALILLIGADVFLLWQLFDTKEDFKEANSINKVQKSQIDSLNIEIDNLEAKLKELERQKEELGISDSTHQAEIDQLRKQIPLMRSAARGGNPSEIAKLRTDLKRANDKAESERMRAEAAKGDYSKLENDSKSTRDSLKRAQELAEKLGRDKNSLNKKIKEGSALKADNIIGMGIKVTSKGETPTPKAKKANKIKVSCKIQQNLVADAGPKMIYMRVLDPSRQIITSNANEKFTYEGSELPFTQSQEIDYQNKDREVNIKFGKATAFVKGAYTVEIYEGGLMIGKSSFTLK
ncbi:MAG: hypothetical protein SGJ10_05135 [Bacteroidota bacterium]|nr:hypothetical protein [Bacteroidota bacterium]